MVGRPIRRNNFWL